MTYPNVCLRRGEAPDIRAGQTLIFENELDWADDTCTDGCIVDVLDEQLHFTARGFFNSRSKITVRVLTRDQQELITPDFFRARIESAWHNRRKFGFENSCRVVFGETDGLPGLTVDKFADYLSFQITCLGLEAWKQDIIDILVDLFQPKGIYERDDLPVREKEGLPQLKTCVYGSVPDELEIREHDARMLVSIPNGQKTGHFLDQQENRGRIRPYCENKSVLDLCCCTGGFSVHAALYGASHVTSVDVSEQALSLVRRNAALNGVEDKITTVCENVFDLAKAWSDEQKQFGLVICDPPAFAKSRKALDNAYRGYKELNLRCMKMVESGGFLVSCSCSQFMTPELFLAMLREAAHDAGRDAHLLELLMQSRDHPAALSSDHSLPQGLHSSNLLKTPKRPPSKDGGRYLYNIRADTCVRGSMPTSPRRHKPLLREILGGRSSPKGRCRHRPLRNLQAPAFPQTSVHISGNMLRRIAGIIGNGERKTPPCFPPRTDCTSRGSSPSQPGPSTSTSCTDCR